MKKLCSRNLALFAFCFMMILPVTDAFANNGKGKGRGNEIHHALGQKNNRHRAADHMFTKHDRTLIARYLRKQYQGNCPPGLAKKNNGCLPPGQAKKYGIGDTLPDHVWRNLPRDLLGVLSPAPRGHKYVQADRDVFLINEASKRIIDAITLFSAVDN